METRAKIYLRNIYLHKNKTRVKYSQQLTRTALTIFPLHCVIFILFIESKSSKFTSCFSFSSPGVRTEQDLYIRLIDSMTKQVSCCCTFSFSLFLLFKRTVQHGAPCALCTNNASWKLSPHQQQKTIMMVKKNQLCQNQITGETRADSLRCGCLCMAVSYFKTPKSILVCQI